MPADGVMRQGARGLGQNHREGDENERLPKFGNFEPDQKCDEGRARRRKETTEGALRKIVSLGCEPGRQIKQDRKSTRLNSSHRDISYAVFCLKKKKIAHLANGAGWLQSTAVQSRPAAARVRTPIPAPWRPGLSRGAACKQRHLSPTASSRSRD